MATKKDRQSIIAKVAKLLGLAKNEAASENEAAVALAQAKKLMAAHDLAETEILVDDDGNKSAKINVVDQPGFVAKRNSMMQWEKGLSVAVAALTETSVYISRGGGYISIRFVGTESDVAIAGEMFKYLRTSVSRLARADYKQGSLAWRSFCQGYVIGIHKKIQDIVRERDAQEDPESETTALIFVGKKDAIAQFTEGLGLGKDRRQGSQDVDRDAYVHGRLEGAVADVGTSARLK